MKAVYFLFLLLVCAHQSYSQDFIGRTPSSVKRNLDRHMAKTNVSGTYERTDTSLTLHIRDAKYQPVDFIFRFENNRCVEEVKVGCDSCIRKYLKEALGVKFYGWSKAGEGSYVSRRLFHRVIEVKHDPSSLVIRKANWRREEKQAATGTK